MVSTIWGICFSLKANPSGSNAKSFDTVLPRFNRAEPKATLRRVLRIDLLFEFFQVRDYPIERWIFHKNISPRSR